MTDSIPAGKARLPDGFIHRGDQVTRLQSFVDAAFAFAVTLLVISIDAIPGNAEELVNALRDVPAFGVSFVMVAMFWLAHVRWSRRYGLEDGASTILSLTLVFLVLVFVYPLKMIFATFMAWISQGWLSPDQVPTPESSAGFGGVLSMFVIYGLVFITLSACLAGLYAAAWRRRRTLALDVGEREATMGDVYSYLWFVVVGVVSVLLALLLKAVLSPDLSPGYAWLIGLPGMIYVLLSFTAFADRIGRRRAQAMEAAA